MCEACHETPDGNGRRCNRPDGQMTDAERDQRNRSRNLGNARDRLARGDAQGAADSLAQALNAQVYLDGGPHAPVALPQDTPGPQRDFVIAPSDLATAMARVEQVNNQRERAGLPPVTMEITRQHRQMADPILSWEQATVRVSGATQEDLDAISMGSVRTDAEARVDTQEVLSAAVASSRLSGGYVPARQGKGQSTPGQVEAYVADQPGGPMRTHLAPTDEDRRLAAQVRAWVRTQPPTNDYVKSVRDALSEDRMSLRKVGLASSAISGFQRHQERVARAQAEFATADPAAGPAVYSPRPQGSRWLGRQGDLATVEVTVEEVVPQDNPYGEHPRYLYVMRTQEGDLVRWVASQTQGMRKGDHVTLRGKIRAHSTFHGEKQTEMFYCKPAIHI